MKTLILSIALVALSTGAPGVELPLQAIEITEDTWHGALTDWDCKQATVDRVCPVGPNTRHFALSIDGGVLLYFDEHGNELTLQALRQGQAAGSVDAIVVGQREGRLLRVESVRIGTVEIS